MKTNKNITLSIEDLVLLKQYPKEYLKKELENLTIKTHDGTSSGPINNHIKDFIGEYKNNAFRVVSVFNKDGKLIKNDQEGVEDEYKQEVPTFSKEELEEMGTDNHIIYKPTAQDNESHAGVQLPYDNYDNRYSEPDKYLDVPNEDDLERLTYTNEDGEQLVRSITMISGFNGGANTDPSVTIIKNNKYSIENNEALMNAGKKLDDVVMEYRGKQWDIRKEIEQKWEQENGIDNGWFINEKGERESSLYHPTYQQMRKEAYETVQNELPDIYTYIEQSGVYDDFENANAKLKIRKNPNIEEKYPTRGTSMSVRNQRDYEETWEEGYGEPYYIEYEPDW